MGYGVQVSSKELTVCAKRRFDLRCAGTGVSQKMTGAKKCGRSLCGIAVAQYLLNLFNGQGGTFMHNDMGLIVPLSSKLSVTCMTLRLVLQMQAHTKLNKRFGSFSQLQVARVPQTPFLKL